MCSVHHSRVPALPYQLLILWSPGRLFTLETHLLRHPLHLSKHKNSPAQQTQRREKHHRRSHTKTRTRTFCHKTATKKHQPIDHWCPKINLNSTTDLRSRQWSWGPRKRNFLINGRRKRSFLRITHLKIVWKGIHLIDGRDENVPRS